MYSRIDLHGFPVTKGSAESSRAWDESSAIKLTAGSDRSCEAADPKFPVCNIFTPVL